MQVYLIMENFNEVGGRSQGIFERQITQLYVAQQNYFCAEFPKTVGGKIDRKALK